MTFLPFTHRPFVKQEEMVLRIWEEKKVFLRSVEQTKKNQKDRKFVFYDGPPFATGLPHYGHFVASTLKDTVARFFTMKGHSIERRFGWDTHGLPIEMETEKNLGLSGPSSIKAYGIDRFNEACRNGVLKYTQEWRHTITRLGRFVDFDNDYKTMDLPFMESVWWVFKRAYEKGLIYQGFRVMPYSYRLSTPLSNFEANLDYRQVQDPALTVAFNLINDPYNAKALIWTTTPWTLPSNLAIAVHADIQYIYAKIENKDQVYLVAKDRAESILGNNYTVLKEVLGSDLKGKAYEPLFTYFSTLSPAFQIILADHVTTETGTGLVHMAPAFGQEDYDACHKQGLAFVDPVDEEGRFGALVPDFEGLNIKEADPKIIKFLKDKGHIFKHDTLEHSYPFCWRSQTPLIYKAVPTWFLKVEVLRKRMHELNQSIHWVPEVVGEKRFGNWLKDAQDWSISRNRFWGTPIPIWVCKACEHLHCLGSVQELREKTKTQITDIHPHKIDHLTFSCEACGGDTKRISEVFDCWFESGSMPYAQAHYPFAFENEEAFLNQFPAEFISEGLDQTRGWFYTLLVISTALFDSMPFKNVIVSGLVLAKDGTKMSKSKKNYPDPLKILGEHGADALRAYLINSPVVRSEPLLFNENGVKEMVRLVLLPLQNAWSFFVQYASIDNFDPKSDLKKASAPSQRPEIDQWILSRLQHLILQVNEKMEGYYLYEVIPPIFGFIDDLTNWYIRRNRRRFWKSATDEISQQDKQNAYATLYTVLVDFSQVLAPVLPFMSETLYQNLVVEQNMNNPEQDSVHLCDYPSYDAHLHLPHLEQEVALIRQVVGLGRALREKVKIKTRQPLAKVKLITHHPHEQKALFKHQALLLQELNVKALEVSADGQGLSQMFFKANYKTLGKRYGQSMPQVSAFIESLEPQHFYALQQGETLTFLNQIIGLEDLLVTQKPLGNFAIETQAHLSVALDTQLSDTLKQEGFIREFISQLQKLRKDQGLAITARIDLHFETDSRWVKEAILAFETHAQQELLANQIQYKPLTNKTQLDIEDHKLAVEIIPC